MRRLLLLVLLLPMLLVPAIASAQDRALHWERYDYTVDVEPDGDLRFTERQVLVVDQGSFRTGSLGFRTGEFGRVRGVEVSENGEPYRRGADQPGTYTASDNGERFELNYVFRDPNARRHELTIVYTVAQALAASGDQAALDWDFFCSSEGCPRIDAGAVEVRMPAGTDGQSIEANVGGAPVRQTAAGATPRWELTEPVTAQALEMIAQFPRGVLLPNATFRGSGGAPAQNQPVPVQPGAPVGAQPGQVFDPISCMIVLFFVFFAFSVMRRSMARRPYVPHQSGFPPFGGGIGGGFGFPPQPRGRRRRGYGGWGGGGFGIPPIIPMPPIHPRPRQDLGGPFDSTPGQNQGGGGGMSWGDSGGGGSSWNDSSGGGSSWTNAGGGGSSWGGGGGNDGGSSGGGGGGGSDNSSRFG
ncbi:MAG: Beta-propeller domains of methanol dehydrogenase type [uncultured Chloroflexia bacterium]|uniref:Beta-propeller domains of methanol dehydrogenase type n=1 Tax=uncultured Chloroflexia bacterium TaxID=1672391 RepID=A0A6J4HVH9_9CHLR|nr:MAG: Beta-propeller domains of methanol dehydrogenase type [uncultured Chloroflexia bacterium]